ncbi:acyltransferase [uncultured Microbacterium sp.]|uniref:acyltransferase family protein n=1 Tax=uncultured Microbacterium sp. TaxID=191216 RepID=UPI0028E35CFD|nr:acyltransferase [uncultured Microbacterium sp.]
MPAVDGLRAVAVSLVVFIHAVPTTTFPGEIGVDIFFVISGFLITLILLKGVARTGTIRLGRFYAGRALRLYPPLIVVTLATVLVALFPGQSFADATRSALVALLYLGNIFMTVTGHWIGDLSHTWSLAMEEQFYLVWPAALIVLIAARVRRGRIVGGLALVALAMTLAWFLTGADHPFSPLTRGIGLIVGCALAILTGRSRWYSPTLSAVGAVTLVVAMTAATIGALPHIAMTPIAVLAVSPILLHLAYGGGWPVTLLSAPAAVYLGVISYEIYLWHYPIFAVLLRGGVLPPWGVAAVGVLITLALSVATHRLVSAPVLRWRDRRRAASL